MASRKDDRDNVEEALDPAGAMAAGRRQAEQMRSMMAATGARVYGDMREVSRGDVDVLMQTSARLAKGMQDMSWEMMSFTQHSLQLGLKTANDLMTCRTVEDMMAVQSNFMRQSVDTLLQESARLLEMSGSMASEAVHPIQNRMEDMRH